MPYFFQISEESRFIYQVIRGPDFRMRLRECLDVLQRFHFPTLSETGEKLKRAFVPQEYPLSRLPAAVVGAEGSV